MPRNPSDRIAVDLQRQETEAGWVAVMDRFSLRATPLWFNWIGWVFALAALQFLCTPSRSMALGVVLVVSYALLYLYFVAFFFRIEFRGLPLVKTARTARVVSLLISGALAFASWRVATLAAHAVAQLQAR